MCRIISAIICTVLIIPGLIAQETLQIPDDGWRLWPDTAADWENDTLYLPDEVNLDKIPVNIPTGGWEILTPTSGREVELPATVEQYYWGNFGFRPYKNAYYFEEEDNQVQNGNYPGVSWWWIEFDIPENFQDKQITLFIRAARLRAEVYLNRQLVGYHIIGETSFICDLTAAAKPGEKNLLAIRITNPGGRFDWVDTGYLEWGDYRLHASHGFGGLDRGIILTAHDPVYLSDLWTASTPDIKTIIVHGKITSKTDEPVSYQCKIRLLEYDSDRIIREIETEWGTLTAYGTATLQEKISYPDAAVWNIDSPNLYRAELEVISGLKQKKKEWVDKRQVTCAFRWFEAAGIDENALLLLNGERIRLISAISWGFWGLNGLWPTPELAEKEVLAAKAFGMNCINFHRNIGKTEVLEAQDRLGLLRFMEPGGGQTAMGEKYSLYAESPQDSIDTSGKGGEPETFAEKYMEEKIVRMIRDHRRHPSLLMYCIQNEINPDLRNPRIFHLIHKIHQEDPSRIILLKSGIPPTNQVWMRPYIDTVYYDRGDGYSGWWDRHTVGGPGIWQDDMYKNLREFTHYSSNDSEVVVWGEMLGAAVPDNHPQMIRVIQEAGRNSYDLKDHREIDNAYNDFLDKWNFRTAFPKTEDLFLNIGNKCYDFWGRVIETARLAEANDFLVISGWESTAIENHSGLLDNLRNFKGNPNLLKDRFAPVRAVVKSKKLVTEVGGQDTLDIYLLNESSQPVEGSVLVTIISPEGSARSIGRFPIPEWKKDQFVYPLALGIPTQVLRNEGFHTLELSFTHYPELTTRDSILVIQVDKPLNKQIKIGYLLHDTDLPDLLNTFSNITAEPYKNGDDYDVIVTSTRLLYGWRSVVDSTTEILNTDDDRLFHTESWGYWRNLEYFFTDLPADTARVTLRFAEVTLKEPGDRIMNVAINGDTVLDDFDIVSTAGGPNIAIDTSFTVNTIDGTVKITIPKLTTNYAKFSAIKIESGDTVIAINAGGEPYRDENGLLWDVYGQKINLDENILARVKGGTSLLLLPDGEEATDAYARTLAEAGAFQYEGHVGQARASWMGSWLFVRENPVFDGLPVNQAMKSYYQSSVRGADGILLDGDAEVFVGYGRDHDRNIGAASFSASLEQGEILFHSLPGLAGSSDSRMNPVIRKRLLNNSIGYLLRNKVK